MKQRNSGHRAKSTSTKYGNVINYVKHRRDQIEASKDLLHFF